MAQDLVAVRCQTLWMQALDQAAPSMPALWAERPRRTRHGSCGDASAPGRAPVRATAHVHHSTMTVPLNREVPRGRRTTERDR